jgi:hypothetical protein
MGEERIVACQALWRRALCVSRFRILGMPTFCLPLRTPRLDPLGPASFL